VLCWFAVLTKPRAENLARENLERQGFECRLPRTRRLLPRAEGVRAFIEPLFPRYLFLRADPERQDLGRVRSTYGVSALVRRGLIPAEVPESVIEALDARTDVDSGCITLAAPSLRAGDTVRVTQGPFAGIEGVFGARSARDRVLLLIELLGERCRVHVPLSHLAMRI